MHSRALSMLLVLAGCAGANPAPADTTSRGRTPTQDDRSQASQFIVGLSFSFDETGETTPRPVQLEAVVRDSEGRVTTHDLGRYAGTARHVAPGAGELAHVVIEGSDGRHHVVLRNEQGGVAARHYREGEDVNIGDVVRSIALPGEASPAEPSP